MGESMSAARAAIGSGFRLRPMWWTSCAAAPPERSDPTSDDYVFTVEVEQWVSSTERRRRRLDPKQPRSSQALGRMVKRVCKRAGIPGYSPHPLRHGFGNRFLRESNKDLATLQALYGHSRPDTTQGYTDELSLDEQAEALSRALERRDAQVSSDLTTLGDEPSSTLETGKWRRRESNPRKVPPDYVISPRADRGACPREGDSGSCQRAWRLGHGWADSPRAARLLGPRVRGRFRPRAGRLAQDPIPGAP
jgi:hypothetical protein